MESDVYIDDVRLQDLGLVVLITTQEPALPNVRNQSVIVPSRHGAHDLGGWFDVREFELNCMFERRKTYGDLKHAIRQLNTLFIDEWGRPKTVKLRFGDEPHVYYKVRLTNGVQMERIAKQGMFTLVLTAFDPYGYAPATYYDPDVVGNYADSVYGFEIVGKHDANNKPIENPTLLGQIGGRNLVPGFEIITRNDTTIISNSKLILHATRADQKISLHDYRRIPVEPDTTYTFSSKQGRWEINERDENHNYLRGIKYPTEEGETLTFTTHSDTRYIGLFTYNDAAGDFVFEEPKLEKGNRATDWTPAPEDEGWPMKLVIEDKFYGDGTKNDRLIFEDGELYKEQWWEIINGVPYLKDKPEKKLVKQKGAIYIAEGINTIHLTDDSGLLDSAIIRYQKGTIPIAKGDNIIDIPKLDFNTYGVDLEYKNQVYSPLKNKRQYVGVYNYSQYETPFSFVIQGYCRNPRITNQTTGKSLKFNNLTLDANERLYVDSRRMTAWKIKIADDKYEFLTPHKIMMDYDAWDKINAHPNKSGDFLMLTAGSNSILFESDDTPDAEIYLDWEYRFL